MSPIPFITVLWCLILAASLSGKRELPEPLLMPYALPNVHYGSLDLGDYDLDGDLDLLITGMSGERPIAGVYRLEDSLFFLQRGEEVERHVFKTFRNVNAILNQVSRGSAKWGDYDGDGDLDVLLTGLAVVEEDVNVTVRKIVTEVYENRNGVFVQDVRIVLAPVFNGSLAWGDYDADGDLDAIVSGASRQDAPYDPATYLLRNDDGLLVPIETELPGTMFGDADWADFDGDGDLDLVLMGQTMGPPTLDVWENVGSDSFIPLQLNVHGLAFGSVDWGDYDGDGDPDLVVTGGRLGPHLYVGETLVLRNDGNGRFTDVSANVADVMLGDSKWADFDNDGDLDLAIIGRVSPIGEDTGWIYLNEGDDRFVADYRIGGLAFSSMAVGDYNGDGDVDFAISGRSDDNRSRTAFYMNRIIAEPIPEDLFPR